MARSYSRRPWAGAYYQTDPTVYTLNGFMFTLIGLYDWWKVAGSDQAKEDFLKGVKTLEHILPYYDLTTISAYDLSYVTHVRPKWLPEREPHVAIRYHVVHLNQLQAINSIHPSPTLKEVLQRWGEYLE